MHYCETISVLSLWLAAIVAVVILFFGLVSAKSLKAFQLVK